MHPLRFLMPPERLQPGDLALLFLVGVAMVIGQYDFGILTLALPDVQASFAVNEEVIGQVVAWARIGAIPSLFLALWADQIGRRRLLLGTLIGFSVMTFATAFATSIEMFIAAQFLARIFTSAEEALAVVFILEMSSVRNRGWSIGFLAAMGALGTGLASIAYGFADIIPYGWRGLYVLAAVPVLYIAWLRRRLPETDMFEAIEAEAKQTSIWTPIQEILVNYKAQMALLALIVSLFWFQMSPAINFMSKYLQETHGYSRGQVSSLFIVAGASALVANLAAGRLSDRIGRKPTVMLALLLNAGALMLFYNTSGIWLPLAWIFALLGFFAVDVILKAVGAELFPTSCRSTASQAANLASVIALAIGFVLEGSLYMRLGSHAAAVTAMVPVSLLAIPLIWFGIRETAGKALD